MIKWRLVKQTKGGFLEGGVGRVEGVCWENGGRRRGGKTRGKKDEDASGGKLTGCDDRNSIISLLFILFQDANTAP